MHTQAQVGQDAAALDQVLQATASSVQVVVPMLPLAQAEAVRDELLFRAESDPRPFM